LQAVAQGQHRGGDPQVGVGQDLAPRAARSGGGVVMRRFALVAVAALLLAACSSSEDPETGTGSGGTSATNESAAPMVEPYASEIYAELDNWICHPDKAS